MDFALLETVVLNRDLPVHGLRAGDLGAVVEVYPDAGVEVRVQVAVGGPGGTKQGQSQGKDRQCNRYPAASRPETHKLAFC